MTYRPFEIAHPPRRSLRQVSYLRAYAGLMPLANALRGASDFSFIGIAIAVIVSSSLGAVILVIRYPQCRVLLRKLDLLGILDQLLGDNLSHLS